MHTHKRGDKVQFRGYAATVIEAARSDRFQIAYTDAAGHIHIIWLKSL